MSVALAWAAGLFDGEGYIGATSDGRKLRLRMEVAQTGVGPTPPEVLVRFLDAVKVGVISGPYTSPSKGSRRKPVWKWRASSQEDTTRVANLLWPYLSEPKKRQAREAFLAMTNRRSRMWGSRRIYTVHPEVEKPESLSG